MRFEVQSFRTRVARRIFVLFVLCALLPIFALAAVSYLHVRSQLVKQSRATLRQESVSAAMSIFQQLSLLRAEMRMAASSLVAGLPKDEPGSSRTIADVIKERFDALLLIRADGRVSPLFGNPVDFPEISGPERNHLLHGKALLSRRKGPHGSGERVFMSTALSAGESPDILMGEIKRSYLWEATERLAAGVEVCVLDRADGNVYVSTSPHVAAHIPALLAEILSRHAGNIQWEDGGKAFVGGYWSLFIEPHFFLPELLFLSFQPADDVFSPMVNFTKLFPAILALSLALVFVLSSRLIRRNLVPIEVLKEATRKISEGQFGHKVEIRSRDEFENLASSFNEMSAKLEESQRLLVKSAKLSTMGQMAGGIMHEVKQPLTAISGLVQLAMLTECSPEGKERLETVMVAVNRLNGILTRFKSFSHMSSEVMQPVSMKEVLDLVTRLLEHQFMMNQIECSVEYGEKIPAVMGDGPALQQVFSNLLINSADALEAKEKPRLIKVRTCSKDGKVLVKVEDNGCGMDEEIQKKIFDPFFSTKAPEKGTGLGMPIIETILHKHHATIHLQSEVGVGTTFTLTFPACSPEPAVKPNGGVNSNL